VVDASTDPRRFVAPAWKSIASTSEVFPVPRCPTTATFRILLGSKGGTDGEFSGLVATSREDAGSRPA
jgi:hypothetical protein